MAKTCCVRPETARAALKKLESLSLLRREDRTGKTSVFRITDEADWKLPLAKEESPTKTQGARNDAGEDSQKELPLPLRTEPVHPLRLEGVKGYPIKGIQEGNPKKEAVMMMTSLPMAEQIYAAFPYKTGERPRSLRAISSAIETSDPKLILEQTVAFASVFKTWVHSKQRDFKESWSVASWFRCRLFENESRWK